MFFSPAINRWRHQYQNKYELVILEENPNSFSFDQSYSIKENKKKIFN
jgi:hypothetical protein